MQIEVKTSPTTTEGSSSSNEVSPAHVFPEIYIWEKQEDLTLRFLKNLSKTWTTIENAFSGQKEAGDLTEFKHLALSLDCIEWTSISSPNTPGVSTCFISLKKDYNHVSVVLLI